MKPTDPPRRNMAADHGGGHAYTSDEMHNEGVGHEDSDVNVRAILGFGGLVAGVTIACAVIVWGCFVFFEKQAASRDPVLSPLAKPAAPMPLPTVESPIFSKAAVQQLVTDEPAVLRTLRASENKLIHEYAWVDERGGVARVPIEQAKKVLAERGLPSRSSGAVGAQLGTHVPAFGEATSGRSIPTAEAAPAAAPQEPPAGAPAPKAQPDQGPSGRGGGD